MATTSTSALPRLRSGDHALIIRGVGAGLALLQVPGAVFGGIEMIRHPLFALGVTPALIEGSPFDTFLWPGILLLVLNGIVPCVLAAGALARVRGALPLLGAWGAGLMAWIVAQWILLTDRMWLQPALFILGAVVAAVASVGWRRGMR